MVNVGTAAGVVSSASQFSALRSIARLLGSQRNRQLTDIAHPQTGTGTVGESLAATRVPSTLRPPKTRRVCPEDHLPGLAPCLGDATGEHERSHRCSRWLAPVAACTTPVPPALLDMDDGK